MAIVRIWLTVAVIACGGGGTAVMPDAPPVPTQTWPPPSAGHDLVYVDSLAAVVLVNAGLGGPATPPPDRHTELWSWDGAQWTAIDRDGPPIRSLAGVAYDSARDELVVHGGSYSLDLMYSDTWTWQAARGWKRFEQADGPGVRDHLQMTYDAARSQIVLFGGQASLTDFPASTWTWSSDRWTEVAVGGTAPPARVHHAMTYDPGRNEVVVFGGFAPAIGDRGDTWLWSGAAWAQSGADIAARTHARMAYDANRGAAVLVGSGAAGDKILVRDAASWHDLGIAGPPARYLAGVTFDKHRNVLVVFGGGAPVGDRLLDDLWELDAAAWHQVIRR